MRYLHANINFPLVLECLEELKDRDFQKSLWIMGRENEVSGLNDVVAGLYDDSLLGRALDHGEIVFSTQIDDKLRKLDKMIARLPQIENIDVLIDSEAWKEVTLLAGEIYAEIKNVKTDE